MGRYRSSVARRVEHGAAGSHQAARWGGAAPQSFVRRRRSQPETEAIDGASTWKAGRQGALKFGRARRIALRELSTRGWRF
jgi:hypothetical protein